MKTALRHLPGLTMLFCVLSVFSIFSSTRLLADLPPQNAIRVACVGDSITYGSHLTDREKNSYPAQLGDFLGAGYDVRNFGVSGATLLHKGDLPYLKQPAYTNALLFKPDDLVILLGTNDSKHRDPANPDSDHAPENWTHKADFVSDYENMIASFRQANPAVKIYVCLPTPSFPGHWGINGQTIHDEVIPLVREVANESHVGVIDFYSVFAGKKDLFPDTVHPNNAGAKLMAATVYGALTGKTLTSNTP
jgi:lysophospholipase L1-like esterase